MASSGLLRLIVALALGCIAAGFSRALRLLTSGGALAAGVLAALLVGCGGLQWLLPTLFFFLSSSALSRARDHLRPSSSSLSEKGSERDAAQVLANGGIGAVLVLLWQWYPSAVVYAAYLGSLAAATADTWATELGSLSRSRPVLVTTGRRVEPGTSGALSAAGCAGGALGALLLAASGSHWIGGGTLRALFILTLAGIAGSLVDSFLGALAQVQYRCASCGVLTEREAHCNQAVRYDHGARWLTNDWVNLLCNLSGAILALFLWWAGV